ncbi:MAG: hypothetical protein ACI3X1_03785 [Eubacteriales bacterium]
MTFNENDEATLACESGEEVDAAVGASEENITDSDECEDTEKCEDDGREEYERLIRDKYKEHFAADTQRLINKRFKKYKALEEKVKKLEEDAARYADIEKLIADERERAVRETEERMNRQFRINRARAYENALTSPASRPRFDVSKLTKDERALLATRAQKGEKIHL